MSWVVHLEVDLFIMYFLARIANHRIKECHGEAIVFLTYKHVILLLLSIMRETKQYFMFLRWKQLFITIISL